MVLGSWVSGAEGVWAPPRAGQSLRKEGGMEGGKEGGGGRGSQELQLRGEPGEQRDTLSSRDAAPEQPPVAALRAPSSSAGRGRGLRHCRRLRVPLLPISPPASLERWQLPIPRRDRSSAVRAELRRGEAAIPGTRRGGRCSLGPGSPRDTTWPPGAGVPARPPRRDAPRHGRARTRPRSRTHPPPGARARRAPAPAAAHDPDKASSAARLRLPEVSRSPAPEAPGPL